MRPWRSRLAVAALSAAAVSGGFYGGNILLEKIHFGITQAAVDANRADLSDTPDLSTVFRHVGKVVEPSVVNIQVRKEIKAPAGDTPDGIRQFFKDHGQDLPQDLPPGLVPNDGSDNGDGELEQVGTGSGVIMEVSDGYGYILTNNHVAGGATEMEITLADGRTIKNGKLLGADPKSDLAVVRIKADDLIAAKWGNSDDLEKGDWVLAFGSPFGFIGSMTHGIVSALNRTDVNIIPQGYENFIQVDAPINPGNSGGPLVNLHGEVVGINTAIASRSGGFQGIGFAIPSDQAREIYTDIKEHGSVVRGYLGVVISDVSSDPRIAQSFGYTKTTGVIVDDTGAGSPAAGKLHPRDVIEAYNGKPVDNVQELRNAVADTAPGTEATLTVFRNGKDQDVDIKIGDQPADMAAAMGRHGTQEQPSDVDNGVSGEVLGMTLETLNDDLDKQLGVDAGTVGVAVKTVAHGSLASQAGITPGTVITQVGDTKVTTAHEAYEALKAVDPAKGVRLSLLTSQGNMFMFLQSDQNTGQ